MFAISAVYDGIGFKPKEPIPVNEEYEVVITFTTPVKAAGNSPKRFSKAEKNNITGSLFGVLPSNIDLDKEREERLQ